jgi:hypothetical protein
MKKFVMLLFLVVTGMAFAQNNPAESEIKNTINIFFEGLHNGDTLVIDQVVNSDFKLQSAFYNKKGTSILQNDTKAV